MCCFSGAVADVSRTRIFARPTDGGRQLLAYAMDFTAREPVAMVLPLPVDRRDPVPLRFVDHPESDALFGGLEQAFVPREGVRLGLTKSARGFEEPLPVLEVGDYVASWVPTVDRFEDLDPRFRLPHDLVAGVAGWSTWGFAVFALKPGLRLAVRPMVLEFARSDPRTLFFPTVHVHDGELHPTAVFDHTLYLQPTRRERYALGDWDESAGPASRTVTSDLVVPDAHLYRRFVRGLLPNEDTQLAAR